MASILASIDPELSSSSDSETDDEVMSFNIKAFEKYGKSSNSKSCGNKSFSLASSLDPGNLPVKDSYVNVFPEREKPGERMKRQKEAMTKVLEEKLKKSIVGQPGFEKLEKVPTFQSRRQISKQRLKERDKTKGFQWFNMPVAELTEEKKNDLTILQMRKALDPKQFYKRSINKKASKFFQIGTVIEAPADFYSSRIPKKLRKQTLVDELLADAKFRQYQKKKVAEIRMSQPQRYRRTKKVKKTKVSEARFANSQKNSKKRKDRS